ncbi:uncharacterized protein VP01_798g8 [Puccinia sorghi]|uniref:Uncharacterized protein n=1 Tax=Puccinia sorghi TaxID=27349 RepID=A0A0L6UAM4_9BASI|nr:uncharacterized protein VP01_798g8 [Puccinia sorghi]
MPPKIKSNQKKSTSKKVTPNVKKSTPLRGQPPNKSTRKTEVKNSSEYDATDKIAPAVGCPAKGKINGFEMMAINLQNQSPSKINLTPHQMKDQFNTNKEKYKKVHTKSITIDEKLESMCLHHHDMNKLIEDLSFVNPWYKVDVQADNKITKSSTSEPSGNEIRSKLVTWKATIIYFH